MQNGYNFKTTIGVSAGALNGASYTTGQMGRNAHINIRYRHDGRYVGIKAFIKSKRRSVIGFDYIFSDLPDIPPLDLEKLKTTDRKFICVCTNMNTGKAEYFDNKRDNILDYIKASATLPYISKAVYINDIPYYDGGCADRIPFKYALNHGNKKVIVVRTRDRKFRTKQSFEKKYMVAKRVYGNHIDFAINLAKTDDDYNELCDELDEYENNGEVFVIAPSKPINIKMLEGDLNKLKEIYNLGYSDALKSLDNLKKYLRS